LPLLVPGVTYEQAVNVEVIPSVMRTDKVFQVQYSGKQHILHIEFESSHDGDLPSRLLVYNAMLYRDHKCPVITHHSRKGRATFLFSRGAERTARGREELQL